MTKQSFLQGTLILMIAGMITRFLGFINRLVVARLMGEEGVGLYMMALPTLFLVITLTQLGLPVAISKRVAEAEAKNDQEKVKKILTVSFVIVGCTSIIFTTGMIFLSPIIATKFLTDERTFIPLLVISPVVPIIAVTSVLRGYFQGKQNMKPQSYALVIEQITRIVCVALMIKIFLPYGVEYAAAGAMASVIVGEIASLSFLIYTFKKEKTIQIRNKFFSYLKSTKETLNELFSIALPSTGSRMIGSFTNFLEPIIVTQSLAIAGISTTLATKQYGELTGYVMPLLFLPTFITNSLSIALVPSISAASAHLKHSFIQYRIHQAIRISFASGAIATAVLFLFSEQLLQFMYGTSGAKHYLVFMAPCYILLYIQSPLQATLQALDLAKPAMWNNIIGSIIKLTLMLILASNQTFGMVGVALAMCVGVVLVTLLHLATLRKAIQFSIPLKDLLKMGSLLFFTFIAGSFLKHVFNQSLEQLFIFIGILGLFLIIYLFILYLLRFLTKEELNQIPILKKFL